LQWFIFGDPSPFFNPDEMTDTQRRAAQYKSLQKLPQNGAQWAGRLSLFNHTHILFIPGLSVWPNHCVQGHVGIAVRTSHRTKENIDFRTNGKNPAKILTCTAIPTWARCECFRREAVQLCPTAAES
jgi:hypothetical protein